MPPVIPREVIRIFRCLKNEDPANQLTAIVGGPYTGLVNVAITFDGTGSEDPGGEIVSYERDFGDGSTGAVTSHSYIAAGEYPVTLTVTDNDNHEALHQLLRLSPRWRF